MQQVLLFLSRLKENNRREWMEANKAQYEATRLYFHTFVNDLLKEITTFEPLFAQLEAKDCIFRLYRDVRFSKDKTPYKQNYSAYFAEGGKKSIKAGYYLHIEPGGKSMLAGGVYMPSPEDLKKLRQEIDYNGKELEAILQNPDFIRYFGHIRGGKLKTTPKGYTPDHPHIEVLKLKDFTAVHSITDAQLIKPGLVKYISDVWQVLQPLNHFLNKAIE
jgi:uncharacterized protein (TIGR02453 family)